MVIAWRGGATVLGERLEVLGTPRSGVPGAAGTVLALDRLGMPVVVVAVPALEPAMAMDVCRCLATLEKSVAAERAAPTRGKAIVLCSEPPSIQAWRALSVQLGPRDYDLYLRKGRVAQRLEPPSQLAERRLRLPGPGEWSITDWIAAAALLLGLVLTLVGLRGMVAG
jgi:hypothetical protein